MHMWNVLAFYWTHESLEKLENMLWMTEAHRKCCNKHLSVYLIFKIYRGALIEDRGFLKN